MTPKIDLEFFADKDVAAVMAALGEARFVGGCVRDAILGKVIGDIDVATPHEPKIVMERLARAGIKVKPTGIEHGTVTAISGARILEITTLRRDVETDGRHAVVAFTTDWRADAARRDLTINAIYAETDGTLFDPVDGVDDLHHRRVRFIGDADRRIAEDYLRILRFFRFHAWYGAGEPDPIGLAACIRAGANLARLAGERLRNEVLKLLEAPDPRPTLAVMAKTGLLEFIVPIKGRPSTIDLPKSRDPILRLAALHAPAEATADKLRLSNQQRERLVSLEREPGIDLGNLARALYLHGVVWVSDRLQFSDADESLLEIAKRYERPIFPLDGEDALRLGLQGKAIGEALRSVERLWIDSGFKLDRDRLLNALSAESSERARH